LLVSALKWPDAVAAIVHVKARELDTRRRILAGESLSGIIGLILDENRK
jgi:hypothetical protein